MFPFRPRAPAFGGKLKRKRASLGSTESDHVTQLAEGGPVERAIKDDLKTLISMLRTDILRVSSHIPQNSVSDQVHQGLGRSFLQFKAAFREGKFGALHTRCVPPRSDREAYTQLIYSAALSLFTKSTEGMFKQNFSSIVYTHDDFVDSALALFALYALYETCPLPTVPDIRSKTNGAVADQEHNLEWTHSTRVGHGAHTDESGQNIASIDTTYDGKALSCLPMGLSSAEDSKVTFRRVYKSPIRLSRRQYLLIQLLHNVSLQIISSCEMGRTEIHQDGILPWVCSCSLASDAIGIIEKLYKNQCFDFCEYCGPASVEGLAGSEDYYKFVVIPNRHNTQTADTFPMPAEEESIHEEIDLSLLESYHTIYHNKVVQLFRSEDLGLFGTTRQVHSLKSTLSPILEKRRLIPLTDQFSKVMGLLKDIIGVGDVSTTNGIADHSQLLQPIPIEHQEATTSTLNKAEQPMMNPVAQSLPIHPLPFRLSFSPDISSSLKNGVEFALKTIYEHGTLRKASVSKSNPKDHNAQDWLWDEFATSDESDDLSNKTEDLSESEDNTEITSASIMTALPLNGMDQSKNALQKLLSLAQYNNNNNNRIG